MAFTTFISGFLCGLLLFKILKHSYRSILTYLANAADEPYFAQLLSYDLRERIDSLEEELKYWENK